MPLEATQDFYDKMGGLCPKLLGAKVESKCNKYMLKTHMIPH